MRNIDRHFGKYAELQCLAAQLRYKAEAFEAAFHEALGKKFRVGSVIAPRLDLFRSIFVTSQVSVVFGGAKAFAHTNDSKFVLCSQIEVEFDPLSGSFSSWRARVCPLDSDGQKVKGVELLLIGALRVGEGGGHDEAIAAVFGIKAKPAPATRRSDPFGHMSRALLSC